jgi:hypothetical protein
VAGMTYGDLKAEMANRFDANQSTSHAIWLKWALHDIVSWDEWSWREVTSAVVSLVASTQTYSLVGGTPSVTDFGGLINASLELTSAGVRVPLLETDVVTFDRLSNHSRVNGVPSIVTMTGGTAASTAGTVTAGGTRSFAVWPIPLATSGNGTGIIFRYLRTSESVEPSGDSNILLPPIRLQRAIVFRAMEYGHAANNQFDAAQDYNQRATQTLEAMRAEDLPYRTARDSNVVSLGSRSEVVPAGLASAGRKAA